MNNVLGVAIASTLLVSGGAFADAGLELAQAKQCLTCHDVYVPARAPSFRSISTKYNGRNARKRRSSGSKRLSRRGRPMRVATTGHGRQCLSPARGQSLAMRKPRS